jgi:glycerate kinase
MALMLRCPRCKSENDASSAKPGSIIKCLHCRGDMRIPDAAKAAAPGGRAPAAGGGRQSALFRRMTNATVPGQKGRGAPPPGSGGGGGRGASDRGRDLSGLYVGGGIAAIIAIIIVIGLVMSGKKAEPEKPKKEIAKKAMSAPPPPPQPPPPPPPIAQAPALDKAPPSGWEPDANGTLLTAVRPVPTEAAAEKDAIHFIETSNTKRIFAQPFRYMPFVINALLSEDQKLATASFGILHAFCEERNIKFEGGKNPVELTHVNSAGYRGYVYSNWAAEWWPKNSHKLPDAPGQAGHVERTDWAALANEMKSGSYHDDTTPAGAAFKKVKNLGQAAWLKLAEIIDHDDLDIGRSAARALTELTGEKKPLPNEQNRTEVKNAWLTASDAASIIARATGGIPLPVADGGDGTLDSLDAALGGRRVRRAVTGPLGEPVYAEMLLTPKIAVIEMASASGLKLVPKKRRNPLVTRTWGVGELMRMAWPRRIWLGVGGSATVDGGLGALTSLGVLGPRPDPRGLEILRRTTVLCDVTTKFLDAPRIFGPQKGATPARVRTLESWLDRWADLLPRNIRGLAGSGAAGGLAGGLAAFGAKLVGGAKFILDAIGFEKKIRGARLVITGEGKFDATSLSGKAAGTVIDAARGMGIPVAVVCGRFALIRRPPGVVAVAESPDPARAREGVARAAKEVLAKADPSPRR